MGEAWFRDGKAGRENQMSGLLQALRGRFEAIDLAVSVKQNNLSAWLRERGPLQLVVGAGSRTRWLPCFARRAYIPVVLLLCPGVPCWLLHSGLWLEDRACA